MKEHNWKNEHPQYTQSTLDAVPKSPWVLWDLWQEHAKKIKKHSNEIALSTCALDSAQTKKTRYIPTVRMVLLKYCSEDSGFCWYSKSTSEKGIQLEQNPYAEILWYEAQLERQVRVRGPVSVLPHKNSKQYALERPRKSQISAYISEQSSSVSSRKVLEEKHSATEKKFVNKNIPVSKHWCGYSLLPEQFEFWQGRSDRLHDRIRYQLHKNIWTYERLQP